MSIKLSHIGQVVSNIDRALRTYADIFDLHPISSVELTELRAKKAFIPVGTSSIELLQPTDSEGTLARFIRRKGEGLWHLCFLVDDIEKEISLLKARGAQIVEPELTSDLPCKRAFVLPQSTVGVLFELITEDALKYLQGKGLSLGRISGEF